MSLPLTQDTLATLISENEALKTQLEHAQKTIDHLQEQIKLTRKRQYGKTTEASESLQLCLFDEQEADDVTETVTPIDDEREQVTYSRKKRKGSARRIDTTHLPRITKRHDLSPEEKICACGCERVLIGENTHEQIDYVPAKLQVIEHITLQYACRQCDTVVSAKKPQGPMPKCMATNTFLTDVLIKKYAHHLPLYRQSVILAQASIDIPDSTLGQWVSGVSEALIPLKDAFDAQFKSIHTLQVDETPVKVLKPDKQGYMWAYHSLDDDNRFIWFSYHLTRRADIVTSQLAHFKGLLQSDGYSAYNAFNQHPEIIRLGCFDHARRKFVDAIKIAGENNKGLAPKLLKLINRLYKIERNSKDSSLQEKLGQRQTRAAPILAELKDKATQANFPPKSAVGKAINYLLNQWPYLSAYINHPNMPISNCLVENHIRPLALGKKNWLFVGNEKTGNQAALIYSLIQTCRINHINPTGYFNYLLTQTHLMRQGKVNPQSLLPQFVDQKIINISL